MIRCSRDCLPAVGSCLLARSSGGFLFLSGQLFAMIGVQVPVSSTGLLSVGHQWDRVVMDILDMSVTTEKGNRYADADAFVQLIICLFVIPAVIHWDQSREFENHLMQELCLLLGAHKTRMTLCHPASDGLVERLNHTLLMMLIMFAGEH